MIFGYYKYSYNIRNKSQAYKSLIQIQFGFEVGHSQVKIDHIRPQLFLFLVYVGLVQLLSVEPRLALQVEFVLHVLLDY